MEALSVPNYTIGRNLQTLLETWNVSQTELQEILHLGKGTVHNYLKGKSLPTFDTMLRLEALSGIAISTWLVLEIKPEQLPPQPRHDVALLPIVGEDSPLYRAQPLIDATELSVALSKIETRLQALEDAVEELKKD